MHRTDKQINAYDQHLSIRILVGIVNGSWNGLVAELINHETDLVITSLKINSAR